MPKEYLLLTHPPLGQIAEQILMLDGADGRFGEYTGQKPDTTLLDMSVNDISEVFEVVQIAPEKLERVSSGVGRITGFTREGQQATVNIDPLSKLNSIGVISVGDVLSTE
jgi:hypothetical protein